MSRDIGREYFVGLHSEKNGIDFRVLSYEFLKEAVESQALIPNCLFIALLHFSFHAKDILFDTSFPEGSDDRTKNIEEKIESSIHNITLVTNELCADELLRFKEAVTFITKQDNCSVFVAGILSDCGYNTQVNSAPAASPNSPFILIDPIAEAQPAVPFLDFLEQRSPLLIGKDSDDSDA